MKNSYVGGFFELELPTVAPGYHERAIALTNGRACISWILDHEQPTKVYLPYYCCNAVYEPMVSKGIDYEFYNVDYSFEPVTMPTPKVGELLIYLNYFGMMNRVAGELSSTLGRRLVVDNTHNFFNSGYEGSYSFTSARKYFGVPDGAYLYVPDGSLSLARDIPRFSNPSLEHGIKRLLGEQEAGFKAFQRYEESLGVNVLRISEISERILGGIDYKTAMNKRKKNFYLLHEKLGMQNRLNINSNLAAPFCYPFLPHSPIDKRQFYENNIFVPTLWPDIFSRNLDGYDIEYEIAERLLPFPVDHRYGTQEMNRIIELTRGLLE